MIELEIHPTSSVDERRTYVADRPIDFETWLKLAQDMDTELVRGVMIERLPEQFSHEQIAGSLRCILNMFVSHRKLGIVLGSRTAIRISAYDGRLPDLLFVHGENRDIIRKEGIYGAPNVVIEIVSERDRPSDLIALEADYRDVGVPEIVFIDPQKRRARYVRKIEAAYDEAFLTSGRLEFTCIPKFWIEVDWLFTENKPNDYTVIKQLIEAAETGE